MLGTENIGMDGMGYILYSILGPVEVPDAIPNWNIELTDAANDTGIVLKLSGFNFGSTSVPYTQSTQDYWISDQSERLKVEEINYNFRAILAADIELFKTLVYNNKGRLYKITTSIEYLYGYLMANSSEYEDSCGGRISFTFLKINEETIPDESGY